MKPKFLVFDLGGVLVQVESPQRVAALLGPGHPLEEVAARWDASPALDRFETGRCGPEGFARAIVEELGLPLSPGAFLDQFGLFCTGLYPGARSLLEELAAKGFGLACLSDTNPTQWESLCRRFALDRYFPRQVLSYRVGRRKPHPAMYQAALGELGCAPGELLYFDDKPQNIRAAVELHIPARQALGPAQVREHLEELGLV